MGASGKLFLQLREMEERRLCPYFYWNGEVEVPLLPKKGESNIINALDNLFTCADLECPEGHEYLAKLSETELQALLPAYRQDVDKYIRQLIQEKHEEGQ